MRATEFYCNIDENDDWNLFYWIDYYILIRSWLTIFRRAILYSPKIPNDPLNWDCHHELHWGRPQLEFGKQTERKPFRVPRLCHCRLCNRLDANADVNSCYPAWKSIGSYWHDPCFECCFRPIYIAISYIRGKINILMNIKCWKKMLQVLFHISLSKCEKIYREKIRLRRYLVI